MNKVICINDKWTFKDVVTGEDIPPFPSPFEGEKLVPLSRINKRGIWCYCFSKYNERLNNVYFECHHFADEESIEGQIYEALHANTKEVELV